MIFNRRFVVILMAITAILSTPACRQKTQSQLPASQAKLSTVCTVNYPLQYFAQRIAGKYLTVVFPMNEDGDPAFWKPDDAIITTFQKADLILKNGADYAKWTKTASLPLSNVVNTSAAFRDDYIEIKKEKTHSHGPAGKHSHGAYAFTTWLDFQLALLHAEAIRDAFIKRDAANAKAYEQNYQALSADLIKLDTDMKAVGKQLNNVPLIGSHPVYQYLTEAYSLNLKSVHWEPEEMPSAEQWKKFKEMLKEHPAKLLVWEGEPAAEIVQKLDSLGIKSLVFSPSANKPSEGDWLSAMQQTIQNLKAAAE